MVPREIVTFNFFVERFQELISKYFEIRVRNVKLYLLNSSPVFVSQVYYRGDDLWFVKTEYVLKVRSITQ